jgi:hypothetical protein
MKLSDRLIVLPLLVFALLLTGCNSNGDDDAILPMASTWVEAEVGQVDPFYLVFGSSSDFPVSFSQYASHYGENPCYIIDELQVAERDEDIYTFIDERGNIFDARLTVLGDALTR